MLLLLLSNWFWCLLVEVYVFGEPAVDLRRLPDSLYSGPLLDLGVSDCLSDLSVDPGAEGEEVLAVISHAHCRLQHLGGELQNYSLSGTHLTEGPDEGAPDVFVHTVRVVRRSRPVDEEVCLLSDLQAVSSDGRTLVNLKESGV